MKSSGGDDGIDLHEQPSHASTSFQRQDTADPEYSPVHDPYSHTSTSDKQGISLQTHTHSHESAESGGHHDHIQTRARHKYTIRRPRALQFSYRSQIVNAGDQEQHHHLHPSFGTGTATPQTHHSDISSHLPEEIAKERERLDLFVDLIWVGIIGNLSEVFSSLAFRAEDPDAGLGMLVFSLVFLPSWRIWDSMREFLNNYYMDDMVQRAFTFWILVLSVFYGNQIAFLPEDIDAAKKWLVGAYLVILGSFLSIEMVYSIWIVWLRKLVLFQWVLRMPSVGLWIVGINLNGWKAVPLFWGAIVWEYAVPIIIDSRWADRLTPIEYKKALDIHHYQSRLSSFFIIILGEGVLQLVKAGPLGRGLQGSTGVMSWVLLIYYEFSFLYFNRDGSARYVPAAKTVRGGRMLAWSFWHIPLFSSILVFAASVVFIVKQQVNGPASAEAKGSTTEGTIPPDQVSLYVQRAVWTCASSVSVIMCSMTVLALLDKSLDEPGTLKISNRYVRLSMRGVFIVVVLCLPVASRIDSQLFLGLVAMMLLVVSLWEWNVSLDRGGQLVEPKGLGLMMSRELTHLKS